MLSVNDSVRPRDNRKSRGLTLFMEGFVNLIFRLKDFSLNLRFDGYVRGIGTFSVAV